MGAEDQSCAETDLQGKATAQLRILLEQAVGCQRDGRGGRVSGLGNVPADHYGLGKLQFLDHLIDDAHVRLVRDESSKVGGLDAGCVQRLLGNLCHTAQRNTVWPS